MKKTNGIQLVLITAALAACNRPMYQQGPGYTGSNAVPPPAANSTYENPNHIDLSEGDAPDSTNSCPIVDSQLPPDYYIWYDGLRPFFDLYWDNWFGLNGYYAYRYPASPIRPGIRTTIRGGFGRTGHARVGVTAHS